MTDTKILDLQTVIPGKEISIKGLDGFETYVQDNCVNIRPKWIKCSEQMPPLGKQVLLFLTYPPDTRFNCRADPISRSNVRLGGLLYNGTFTTVEDQFDYKELKYVSHWMSLPSPPNTQTCQHCENPDSILQPHTCCTGCSKLPNPQEMV